MVRGLVANCDNARACSVLKSQSACHPPPQAHVWAASGKGGLGGEATGQSYPLKNKTEAGKDRRRRWICHRTSVPVTAGTQAPSVGSLRPGWAPPGHGEGCDPLLSLSRPLPRSQGAFLVSSPPGIS